MASGVLSARNTALLAQGVLVTVHDLYGGSLPLKAMESYLRFSEDHDIQEFRYSPRHQDLATSGKELSEFLAIRKPHTTDETIHFLTHGYGSLVLREAFRHIDWNYTKSKVVMLAPPNRGVKYYRDMKKYINISRYGGVAAEELASFTALDLDKRLGGLPRRCYPLILAGELNLNPLNQANYPSDGMVMIEETTLPGECRHMVLTASHYTLPMHPRAMELTKSFLLAEY